MKKPRLLTFVLSAFLAVSLLAGCSADTGGAREPGTDAGYEEGTSASDEIVNTSPADKVLLAVSFGTSFNQARDLNIGGIEAALQDAYPDYQVRRAFTSQIIIDKLAERENLNIDTVEKAMDRLALDKVSEVVIQPLHVISGYEYEDVITAVMPYSNEFESLKIGKPLLSSGEDYDQTAGLLAEAVSAFDKNDTAVVLMGHGTRHEANAAYAKMQTVLQGKGHANYLVGTVEGGPLIEDVQAQLKKTDIKKVVLRPMMIAAGDHANNDMAGGEAGSWKTILTNDGYTVETVVEGLGQLKGIQDIFVRHVQDAIDSSEELAGSAPVAEPAGIAANRLKDGTYSIRVSSDTSMFKIVDCQLKVANGEPCPMTAVITLSAQGFGKVYMGTGEEALADTEENISSYTDVGGRHTFTVPVEALDKELDCAGYSIRREKWYDHIVVFSAQDIPGDAFVPCQVNVTLTGGSGRAGIHSPAELIYKDGKDFAKIVWSSPNYSYMLVDGVKYLPVNSGGNSAFEIPVALDADMKVTACTTAMSTPKEVEYTLHFDSASIQ